MSAWLEPIAAVVRVGQPGAKHYDAYHLAATVRYVDVDAVEVVGLAMQGGAKFNKSDWAAMEDCFHAAGINKYLIRRVKDRGGRRIVRAKWREIKRS